MVTAELATIAPFAVAFAFLLLWIVSLGLTQIRITDASREAARMVARGESVQDARTSPASTPRMVPRSRSTPSPAR